jgi:hypothetical protein
MRRLLGLISISILGCVATTAPETPEEPPEPPPQSPNDPLYGLPQGSAQWEAMCAKGFGDMISRAFCRGSQPPPIGSLADLRALLGLAIDPAGDNRDVRATMLAHSTAITGRHVTELNPRVFIMTPPLENNAPNPEYQILAFARGEPFVELVANDPAAGTLRFFLVRFHPACEQTGCNFADLLTPSIESNWQSYSIYDDDTIRNTTLDCLQCHQPDGPSGVAMLRMQELKQPWSHWFYDDDFKVNLPHIQSFRAAHGNTPYGGVPQSMLSTGPSPEALQRLVENNGFANQPNRFESAAIRNELSANGTSPTWDAIYANTVAGAGIAVPYFGVPHTDAAKVAAAVAAYRETITGTRARADMPDIRDTVLDSALADLSYRPKAGSSGRGILVHMCQHCHNSKLDQTITRSRFNVEALATLPRIEKDEAIRRLQLPDNDAKKMPPPRYHTLSDAERALVIAELER